MQKSQHRSFLPGFKGFGRVVYRVMVPLVCVFVVLIVPSYLASNANDFYYGSSQIYGADTRLGQDTATIEEMYGKSDTYVAMCAPAEIWQLNKSCPDAPP